MSDRRRTLRLKPETFSREYVEALRRESRKFREQAAAAIARVQALEAAGVKPLDVEDAKDKAAADARAIDSALKALAVDACMFDPDDLLKLTDTSTVTVGTDGQVHGAAELVQALRETKPFLFGTRNTSTPREPPPVPKLRRRLATEMQPDEYAKAKAALIRR